MAQYRAFFSYARADDKLANWLHRQLDSYRTPKALIGQDGALGPVPAKLHPIFRDRTDLDARGHIDQRLQEALEDSECLVVLCTPTSAKSQWVNHECETFLKLGREDRIFPVIGAGKPNSSDPETECFPPALRGKGLLAADLREIKKPNGQFIGDGRDGGRLKLIAGLLGVPLDQLVQRERRRQRLLIGALSTAALVFAGVAATAVVQTIAASSNLSLARKNEAATLRSLATVFVERGWQAKESGRLALAAKYALASEWLDKESSLFAAPLLKSLVRDPGKPEALRNPPGANWGRLVWANQKFYRVAVEAMFWDEDGSLCITLPRAQDIETCSAAFNPIAIAPSGERFLELADDGVFGLMRFNLPEVEPPPEFEAINSPKFPIERIYRFFQADNSAASDSDDGGNDRSTFGATFIDNDRFAVWQTRGGQTRIGIFSSDRDLPLFSRTLEGMAIEEVTSSANGSSILIAGKQPSDDSPVAILWRLGLDTTTTPIKIETLAQATKTYFPSESRFVTSQNGTIFLFGASTLFGLEIGSTSNDTVLNLFALARDIEVPLIALSRASEPIVAITASGEARVFKKISTGYSQVSRFRIGLRNIQAAAVLEGERIALQTEDGGYEIRPLRPAGPVFVGDAPQMHYAEDNIQSIWFDESKEELRIDGRPVGPDRSTREDQPGGPHCDDSLGISPDGKYKICGNALQKGVEIWDLSTDKAFGRGALERPNLAVWSEDARSAVVFGENGAVLAFHVEGATTRVLSNVGLAAKGIWQGALENGGQSAVWLHHNGELVSVDLATDQLRWKKRSEVGRFISMALGKVNGRSVVLAVEPGSVTAFDLVDGRRLLRQPMTDAAALRAALDKSGRLLAVADGARRVRVWEIGSARPIRTFEDYFNELRAVQFTPSGREIVVVEARGRLTTWKVDEMSWSWELAKAHWCAQLQTQNELRFSPEEIDADTLLKSAWASRFRDFDLCSATR